MASHSFIRLPADSTGARLATRQVVIGANTVERQHVEVGLASPQLTVATSASLAPGASATLDSAQVTTGMTGRLWGVDVTCAAPCKAEVYRVANGTPSTMKGLGITNEGQWVFRPVHPAFLTVPYSATAGFDGFRVIVTHLGAASDTSDVTAVFYYDEEVSEVGLDETPGADPIILEDFSNLRTQTVFPTPEAPAQPIWYPQIDLATPTVSANVLTANVVGTSGIDPQLYMRLVDNNGWFFLRHVIESGTWVDNTYNRMRFQFKQVNGFSTTDDGHHTLEVGTFMHNWQSADGPMSGSDENNWHFYHFFDIPTNGLWHTMIIDTWPDHQRSQPGATEYADQNYPDPSGAFSAANINKRYLDLITSFYLDVPGGATGGAFQLRAFTIFAEDNATVPLQQVRSVNGCFTPATNTVRLGWMRRKDQPAHEYTVRYAFAPITTFSSATFSGTFNAPNTGDYNGVHYSIVDAAFASHSYVWVAVQPTGSALFRQWYVPLS